MRNVLSKYPQRRHFTVHHIIEALGKDSPASSITFFAAAGVFDISNVKPLSGGVTAALGAHMMLGRRRINLPRCLLRRKIPRNSLSLLIHGISNLIEGTEQATCQRWSWVFHPAMNVVLGLILFLLGLASMAPIIGGGVQHAASAFLVALGLAERDGLAVMTGAIAGIASLAVAALSIASGRKLWTKIKAWLLGCARQLRLNALAAVLDHCCYGLGDLVQLKWSQLLLMMLGPVPAGPPRTSRTGSATSFDTASTYPQCENASRPRRPILTARDIPNIMDLEQIYVFPVNSTLTSQKRHAVEAQLDENAALFEREVSYKWLKRGEEKFLRILADPVTIEIVFFNERIEVYGAAPAWARLLFTKARKEELKERLEAVLRGAGFISETTA
ncbi:exopolysaccharide biosynthesis protein [Azomonas macrocytogenes]|uniref:Uncharacterized protein n=1 Tax=Azomonas macrocytogenes TaxID=69962 RepID=A0A839T0B7_AZOMA|nr:exopolysaccharide biosynthesis protein [Azomonas macrocytogenes]MBB3102578.1 hypothetical protein [Azomonas macrocytogenes]